MKVLIKSARIICPSSPYHGKTLDIFIENGIISKIDKDLKVNADKTIQADNLHISQGWTDCFASFSDPGYEYKETLQSGAKAAAAGGFTSVAIIPNTNPVIDNKSQVEYITGNSKELPVTIYPIGALTKKAEGKELSEMYDMNQSGAIAFSDGTSPLQSSGIMLKALQYVKAFNGIVIQLPDDRNINPGGLINEGITSTKLGLPGKPAIAEELSIARDIELAKYTDSRIHFTGVSTKRSIDLIAAAKKQGLQVTCSVTPYHLFFHDEDLSSYDTNLKVNPPLRTKEDMVALREAVKNGTVDFIASHHLPHEWDSKTCEFEYAKYGMIGLESMFPVVTSCGITTEMFITMQTNNINTILGITNAGFLEGAQANLTLFDPSLEYTFTEQHLHSKSKNSPFIGKPLKGKVIAVINTNQIILN
jgi:dihydroorotase